MKDSSSSGPRKGRSRNYNNKNRNNNRRHVKQKVPRRAKKKSLVKRILEFFGIGKTKPKKKTAKKNPRNRKTSRIQETPEKNQPDQIKHKGLQKKPQSHQADFTLEIYPTKQPMKNLKNCSIKPVRL